MLVKGNLQMFADGEDEIMDFESELAAFEAEWEEESTEPENPEVEETEETPEDSVDSEESTEEETETPNPNDPDQHRRNQAFADMRKQLEETSKYAEFIKRLAEQGGTTPDELLARFEERQLAAEAQKQNIPVEFLKESKETAQRLGQLEERMRAERLESQIDTTVNKYGLGEDSVRETFRYMLDAGIDPRTQDNVDFEKFYRAANLDSIIQKEVENARQKDLEDKRNRQASASIPNGTSVSPTSGNDMSDEEFEAELKRLNIRI